MKGLDEILKDMQDKSDRLSREITEEFDLISKRISEESDLISKRISEESDLIFKRISEESDLIFKRISEESDLIFKRISEESDLISKRISGESDLISKRISEESDLIPKSISQVESIYNAINRAPLQDQLLLKSLFLKGILTLNKPLLEELMLRIGLTPYTSDMKMLGVHWKNAASPLASEILELVQTVLATENEKSLLAILMNTFQSIPELSFDRHARTLSMKTKKALLPMLLEKADLKVSQSIKSQLTDLSFDAPLPAFRPSIGDENYQKTNISLKNYLALIGNRTDISQFLVLTIVLFTSQNIGTEHSLQKLSADYLFCNYEQCLAKILKKLKDQEVIEPLGDSAASQIVPATQILKKYELKHNNTRRFFETRLAQYINGLSHSELTLSLRSDKESDEVIEKPHDEQLKQDTLKACNKILQFFLGSSGMVDTPREMEIKISIFANGYKDTSKFSPQEIEFITGVLHHAEAHKGRDRMERDKSTQIKERKFETEADRVGSDVWNSGGGVMTGYSPVFYDAQREPMRNMLVDSSTVSPEKEGGQQWFWNKNRQYSSYIGSISGHTCNIVGMLDKYMKQNREDPNLQNDINLFLVQVVGVYAKRGFHAMLEVIDVLHDPYIQEIFANYNVNIDLYAFFRGNPNSAALLRYAMNDAAQYAQVLVTKEHVKEGLKTHSMFSPKVEANSLTGAENNKAKNESSHPCFY